MSTRKELELRVEELLASEAQLIRRIRELESIIAGTEYEELPEPADQRGLLPCPPEDTRGLYVPGEGDT